MPFHASQSTSQPAMNSTSNEFNQSHAHVKISFVRFQPKINAKKIKHGQGGQDGNDVPSIGATFRQQAPDLVWIGQVGQGFLHFRVPGKIRQMGTGADQGVMGHGTWGGEEDGRKGGREEGGKGGREEWGTGIN